MEYLEQELVDKSRALDKYREASNLDISDLEKSYLGDDDEMRSNFSFKGSLWKSKGASMSTQIKEQEGFIDDLKQDLACLLRKYKDIELQNETLAEKID